MTRLSANDGFGITGEYPGSAGGGSPVGVVFDAFVRKATEYRPAASRKGFAAGISYATATASPAFTPSPRRSATDRPASVALSTRQRSPSTVTVNAAGGGAAPASVSSNVSVSVASLAVADVAEAARRRRCTRLRA